LTVNFLKEFDWGPALHFDRQRKLFDGLKMPETLEKWEFVHIRGKVSGSVNLPVSEVIE
jgi:hypothetical protein